MDYQDEGISFEERIARLKDYAKSKDLSVRKNPAGVDFDIYDMQNGKGGRKVGSALSIEQVWNFITEYDW